MKRRSLLLLVLFAVACLLCCCGEEDNGKKGSFEINGAWTLSKIAYPDGQVYGYPNNGMTFLRIFHNDSTYYVCQMLTSPNGSVIIPGEKGTFTLINRGTRNDMLYFEGARPLPLKVVDDTIITIQEFGIIYTWIAARDMPLSNVEDIRNILSKDTSDTYEPANRYVFSKAENRLKSTNHTLIYCIIFVVILLAMIVIYARMLYVNKKVMEKKLHQLMEEYENRPQPIKEAMKHVEDDFLHSDYYVALRKRMATGEHFKSVDWNELESQLKCVYPGFTNNLFSLCKMSDIEYHVCLLTKLHASPTEMANVLCKDTSSISSIRSRLYQKVFGKKGGAKDWDEFIFTL
jgi:hypothetical protein